MALTGPLTDDGRRLVEEAIPAIRASLRHGWHRPYVRSLGHDEALQVACLGAVRAAADFADELAARLDADRQRLFMSYASFWIRSFLGRAAGSDGLIRDARFTIRGRAGPRRTLSLSAPAGPGDGVPTLGETIADRRQSPDGLAADRDEIDSYLRVLSERQRRAVEMLGGGHSLRDVAKELGVTPRSARRIYLQARKRVDMAATIRSREG